MLRYSAKQAAKGLLQTSFALIDQDENSAVISVRIDRKKLADNHDFLALLSDLASSGAWGPARAAPPPLSRSRKWMLTAAMTVAIIAPSPIFNMTGAFADNRPPLEISAVTALTPTVRPGGELLAEIVTHRTRSCPGVVQRVFVRESDGAATGQESVPTTTSSPTAEPISIKVAIRVPSYFKPGRYIYKATVLSTCGSRIYAEREPDIGINVVAPPT